MTTEPPTVLNSMSSPTPVPPSHPGAPAAAPRRGVEAVLTLAWASLLLVAALWAAGGGFLVDGVAAALTSAGRLAGLSAADLLLIQVLLMARLPAIEKSVGQDRLVRVHRTVGLWSFTLITAHVVLILLGYAGTAGTGFVSSTLDVILTMPAMMLAALGTVFLYLVVVTSIRAARRRLRYESWHLMHLYAYLGCFLVLPHQLWTGADFLSSPLATAYWWTLWGAAAVSVLVFRVSLPVVRSLRHRLIVSEVRPAGGGVTTVTLTGRDLHTLPVRGGQFFNWRFLGAPGWTRAHPYSLSAAPNGRTLEISVAALGDGSARVAHLRPGTRVLIEGPYGRLHAGVRTRRKVLLLAGGVGIAPLKSLLESLTQHAGDVMVVHRVTREADAPLLAQTVASADAVGARLAVLEGARATDRPSWLPASWAHVGDTAALRYLCPDVAERDVFVSGAQGWMAAVDSALRAAGVPAGHIHKENFSL
ncbi:MAG: ferredoxin reductase family protein [Dermatophilaceae bacterium]